jgi:hypothetical protein
VPLNVLAPAPGVRGFVFTFAALGAAGWLFSVAAQIAGVRW